jgi:hypothetical protein
MPGKKTDTPEPSESARMTAPALSKTLAKQIKLDNPKVADTPPEHVTVRKASAAQAKPEPEPKEVPTPTDAPATPTDDSINSAETDKAVDDIMAAESDMVLAVDDVMRAKRSQSSAPSSGWKDKLRRLLHNKWTWIGAAIILCAVFALPYTRYKLLGVIIKKEVHITVIDAQNHTPVSNAVVSVAGRSVKTDANGKAELKASVGEQTLTISKQYYRTTDVHQFVGFKSSSPPTVTLLATGRLVPITVDNTISGKPLPGAVIHILSTTAKTNTKGQAGIAVPVGVTSYNATISLAGYNTKKVSVQVTAQAVAGNSFTLTPSGTIYFLSEQNGINVVKANLDGTNPQTVLAASGHESASTTRLFASSDWRYLVLEANRSGTRPALYLINNANNQVTEFDTSNATFNPIGWSGHNFLYSLTSSSTNQWQTGYEAIKTYDADNQQINQISQSQAVGDSTSYAYQNFTNFFLANTTLVYDTQWTAQGSYDLSNQNDVIAGYQIGSQSTKDYESFPAATTGSIAANPYQPAAVYFAVPSISGTTSYYQYADQSMQAASISQTIFNQTNPNYLLSPSGNHSLWSELSNGQDIFLIGNSTAAGQQQIAALDGYVPYGWYSDNYILASRGNDQLYVLPSSGISGSEQPLKITDYYEPAGKTSAYEYGGL